MSARMASRVSPSTLVSKNVGAATMGSGVALGGGGADLLASLKTGALTGELVAAAFGEVPGAFGNAGAPDGVGAGDTADISGVSERPDVSKICGISGAAEKARFR
jgi:hypothetical protein